MPLLYIKDIDDNTKLGLWKIDDKLQLEDACPPIVCSRLSDACESRRKEKAATYALLREMTQLDNLIISHEPNGRPYIDNTSTTNRHAHIEIGISHTKGYVCIILSTRRPVSIDIEYRSDRVKRITDKFLREDEQADIETTIKNNDNNCSQTILLLYWCAKETTYKYYSNQALTLKKMQVKGNLDYGETGIIECTNTINGETLKMRYIQKDQFVMVYK